jgi:hypothetical protein
LFEINKIDINKHIDTRKQTTLKKKLHHRGVNPTFEANGKTWMQS